MWYDSPSHHSKHSCPSQAAPIELGAFGLNDGTHGIGGSYDSGEQGTLNKFAAELVQSVKDSLVGLDLSEFLTVHPKNDMLFNGRW